MFRPTSRCNFVSNMNRHPTLFISDASLFGGTKCDRRPPERPKFLLFCFLSTFHKLQDRYMIKLSKNGTMEPIGPHSPSKEPCEPWVGLLIRLFIFFPLSSFFFFFFFGLLYLLCCPCFGMSIGPARSMHLSGLDLHVKQRRDHAPFLQTHKKI